MEDKIEAGEYVSRKEFLKKNDSIVAYALYVQDNIKKDDYARLNTGQIVKVIGIKENNVNKKAVYYGIYNTDWFDCSAVENFSNNIIDLIEVDDYVNGYKVISVDRDVINKNIDCIELDSNNNYQYNFISINQIKPIVTHEQFSSIEYKITKED